MGCGAWLCIRACSHHSTVLSDAGEGLGSSVSPPRPGLNSPWTTLEVQHWETLCWSFSFHIS